MKTRTLLLSTLMLASASVFAANPLTTISNDPGVQQLTEGQFLIHLKFKTASSDWRLYHYEVKTQAMDGPAYKCTDVAISSSDYSVVKVGTPLSCSQ